MIDVERRRQKSRVQPSKRGMMSTATKTEFVQQMIWRREDGVITVTPEDESRFSIKLNKAIEILREAGKQDSYRDQFRLLARTVAQWLSERQDKVKKAYLTVRDGMLSFVVVRNQVPFDDALEDDLSELDLKIAKDVDLDLIKLCAIALPLASDEAISSFLNPEFSLLLTPYGKRS